MQRSALRFWLEGYAQQLVALGTLLGFNLLLPLITGLSVFGSFTTIMGLVLTAISITGGGLDLFVLRELVHDGRASAPLLRRMLRAKFLLGLGLGVAMITFRTTLIPADVSAQNALAAAVLLVAASLSSLLINVFTAARRNDLALRLSAVHSGLYVLLPIGFFLTHRSVESVLAGTAASYVIIVAAEGLMLRRLEWSSEIPAHLRGFFWNSMRLGLTSVFEVVRSWGTFYAGAYVLAPREVGVAKIVYSLGMGVSALVPVHQQSVIALAPEWSRSEPLRQRVTALIRFFSVEGGVMAAAAVILLGKILYRPESAAFLMLAPWLLLLAVTVPSSRFVIGLAVGTSRRWLSAMLIALTLATCVAAYALSVPLGSTALVLVPAAASGLCVLLLGTSVRHLLITPADLLVVLLAVGVSLAVRLDPSQWPTCVAVLLGIAATYALVSARRNEAIRAAMSRFGAWAGG